MTTSDIMDLYYLYMLVAVVLSVYFLIKCWQIKDYESPNEFNDCYQKFINLVFISMIVSITVIVYLIFLNLFVN